MSKTALYTHPDCEHHEMERHPERPDRLRAVMQRLDDTGLSDQMLTVTAGEVEDVDIWRVHPGTFIDDLAIREPESGAVKVETDTYMSPGSFRAAKLAAGANTAATRAVLNGEYQQAFCAIRPPGHHAEISQAMGFCLFNNVAIAAETALADERIDRVAILDFDVHHCNGTVDIFKNREEVLVCSSFQENFYPFRYLDYHNEHIVSSPLEAGATGRDFRQAVEQDWIPALLSHKPDFIFISAGFDAHHLDPLGQLMLVEEDFVWVTRLLKDIAADYAGGRLVSTLEGGYDLEALSSCVDAHVSTLLE